MTRRPRGAGRVLRQATWPLRRLLDPRFADTNRRVEYSQHVAAVESERTRDLLATETRHIVWQESMDLERRLAAVLDMYATTNRETLSFVGAQLRTLADAQTDVGEYVMGPLLNDLIERGLMAVDE